MYVIAGLLLQMLEGRDSYPSYIVQTGECRYINVVGYNDSPIQRTDVHVLDTRIRIKTFNRDR